MATWKQPPIAKIYEALGALADERVKLVSPTSATVVSSSGDKSYVVEWAEDFSWMTSNDNASFWQGYLGYPIVAVLLLQAKIPFSRDVSEALKGIPWKQINTKHKNNYEKAINEVLGQAEVRGSSRNTIIAECERVQKELAKLQIEKVVKGRRPPAETKETLKSAKSSQGDLF